VRNRTARRVVVPLTMSVVVVVSVGVAALVPAHSSHRLTAIPAGAVEPTPATRPFTVVGLGDSVPAGSACSCTNYVSLVARAAAATRLLTVTVDNFSTPGERTAGLIRQLDSSNVAAALSRAGLVIVTIGANDVEDDGNCDVTRSTRCYEPDVQAVRAGFARILTRLRALTPAAARIVVTGYWNVFRDGAVADGNGPSYVRNSQALTKQVNDAIEAAAAQVDSVTFVDLYRPFKGAGDRDDTALLAADGDHPNAAGHRLIAATITAALTA
jgi:lysophospholipase L1-like esterase